MVEEKIAVCKLTEKGRKIKALSYKTEEW